MTLIGAPFTRQLLAQLTEIARTQNAGAQLVPGANGAYTLQAGAGNDDIRVGRAANGLYGVRVNQQNFFFTKEQLARLTIHAGDGDNRVLIDPDVDVPLIVQTGSGRDRVMNFANRAMIDTGAGEDQIVSRAEQVKIHGGEGADVIDSFGHSNALNGGLGDDLLKSRGNQNLIQGGDGNDALSSGGNNNFLRGGRGDDTLFAGGIQNRLDGYEGNNTMFAGGLGNVVEAAPGPWNNVGRIALSNIEQYLGLGPDAQILDPRGVPQAFDPKNPQGQAPEPGGLLAADTPGAPGMFDALNVRPELRQWTSGCGQRGCCAWEPAIA